jgi:hypothetical protein
LPSADDAGRPQEVQIDLTVAPPIRVDTFMQGGDAHFAVDRDVAERMFASVAGGVDTFRAVGRASQAFLERVVHHLTVEAGLRQFLVTGSNLSGEPNVHDLAQAIVPGARVVYVLFDPVMVAHAHGLRRGTVEGASAYVVAKLRDVDAIMQQAATTFDLSQPVAVVMQDVLGFVREVERANRIVDGLMAGLVPGSHLVITHLASDLFVEEHAEMFRVTAEMAAEGRTWAVVPRTHGEVAKLFDGLDLVEPGIVPMIEWPAPDARREPVPAALHAGVARK